MGRHDWYRLTTWSDDDQEEFYSRLNRSRSVFHKAQYACIQASYLEETKDPKLIRTAIDLLNRVITEWPDAFSLPSAYKQLGTCYISLNEYEKALDFFRDALKAEEKSMVQTDVPFLFCWLIVSAEMKEYYREALKVLAKHVDCLFFPNHEFIYYGVQALIYAEGGLSHEASASAKRALGAMAKDDSGFPYHKEVGIVRNPDKMFMKKLRKITRG